MTRPTKALARVKVLCDVASTVREGRDFDALCDRHEWAVPESMNLAELVCERHARGYGKVALIAENEQGDCCHYTFEQLSECSSRLATVMLNAGVKRGDRVAVILPQRFETAVLHIAAQRIGAISLPLSILFGDDALRYRLQDSGTSFLIVANQRAELIDSLRDSLPALHTVLRVVEAGPVHLNIAGSDLEPLVKTPIDTSVENSFWHRLQTAELHTETVELEPDAPAFLLYTSGTTGPPKGALIPQRALLGNLSGFECSHNGFPEGNDAVFTPADWAWTGGLLDALLPAWYYGVRVVALDYKKFDAQMVWSLMSRHRVTCAFIPPTALRIIRAEYNGLEKHHMVLRSIMSAGETVGGALFEWAQDVLGVPINEMCGQTEHNYLMGNCSVLMPVKPGSMGKAYPGHRVAIMGPTGELLPDGEPGEIVAHKDDPVHFLEYWNNPSATAKKYTGDWFHTGDVGHRDEDGYLWFHGRADDVINSAGYRIGPGEIENCAITHEAVLQVAAIGVPDPDELRGEVVKLCVVLRDGESASDKLQASLQSHIREHLAAYEYPRLLEFFEHLPMTTTGKIQRNVLRQWHQEKHTLND